MRSEKKEKNILIISFIAGLIFAIIEFLFAISTGSNSVLMDAVYDTVELIFIALLIFLTPLFYKPISEKRPYGYFQIESICLIIKGFMLLSVSINVSAEIIKSILYGGSFLDIQKITNFQFLIGIFSIIIYIIMKKMNTCLSSPSIEAELLGWKLDIAYSLGMAGAFFFAKFLDKINLEFLIPYFDQIVAIIIIFFMLPENIKILFNSIKGIFLFCPNEDIVNNIKLICSDVMIKYNFEIVFFDITKTGRHLWIAVYFKNSTNVLLIKDLEEATLLVNNKINEKFENYTCELILIP